MHLRSTIPITLLLTLGGCASGGNDSDPSTDSAFVGRWALSSYTLDDGTSTTVPENIIVGIDFLSGDNLGVSHGLCDSYEITYRLDDGVLTTMDPVFPEMSCDGFHGDADEAERSELVRRVLLNTQTMVSIAGEKLTLTTGRNEVLVFEPDLGDR